MDKIRVVFVEDRNNEWRGLRKLLAADNKLEIYEAASVREAFIKARELPIDVILLDNLLPDMSGFNVCEELMKGLKRTKVIVLSAQNDFSSVQEALSEGCVGFLPQNASYREIRDAIQTVYQGGHYLHPKAATELAKGLQERKKRTEEVFLNDEEIQVLKLIADGLTYFEIASTIYISERTVRRRVQSIFEKLGVNSQAHAVAEAMRREFLE